MIARHLDIRLRSRRVPCRRRHRRTVHQLARLDRRPLVPLHPDANGKEHRGDGDGLPAHLLARVHLRLGGPVQKLDDVLCHLRRRRRRAVLVLDQAVVQHPGHGDARAREVRVEVEARLHRRAGRRLFRVARQQAEDVVAAAVPGLDDEAEIGRQGAVVGGPGGLVVLVGARQVVG